MHELVGQLARAGEQEQAFCVEVEPADRLPLALLQPGQLAKHRWPVLRVIMSDHLAHRLVIGDHPGGRRCNAQAQRLAVDLDGISELDALADVRRLVVDRNPAFKNKLLHLQARTKAGLGQDLVQLWALGLRRQHPLVQLNCRVLLVGVELSGNYVFKAIALSGRCAWLGPGRAALGLIALIGRTGLCARPRPATAPPVRPLALTGLAGLVLRRWL